MNKTFYWVRAGIGVLVNWSFPGLGQLISGFYVRGIIWLTAWFGGWLIMITIIGQSFAKALVVFISFGTGSAGYSYENLPFIALTLISVFKSLSILDLLFASYQKTRKTKVTPAVASSLGSDLPMAQSETIDTRLNSPIIKFFDQAVILLPGIFIMLRLLATHFGAGYLASELFLYGLAAVAFQAAGLLIGYKAAESKKYNLKIKFMTASFLFTAFPFLYYLLNLWLFSNNSF